jgi:hypothetical protein
MKASRALGGTVLTVVLLAGIGGLSQVPYTPAGSAEAVLRLSWRFRGERSETCRPRTPAELEALPVHMRTPEVCEGGNVAYRLVTQVGGARPDTAVVLPGGARGDRPVFVLRESALPPGRHRVQVRFEPVAGGAAGESATLHIDTVVQAEPGVVHLITLDATGGGLVHRSGARPEASGARLQHGER